MTEEIAQRNSIRGVLSVLIAFGVLVFVITPLARFYFLMVPMLLTGQASMSYPPEGVTLKVDWLGLIGLLAVGFLPSITGIVLGATAYRDPACKKLVPVIGLVFNGLPILAVVPITGWMMWVLIHYWLYR